MADHDEIKSDSRVLASRVFAHGGAQMVLAALKEAPMKDRLPGFAYALAIVEAEAARIKADMHLEVLREGARKGIDIGANKEVGVRTRPDLSIALYASPADLVDMAEFDNG